MPPQHHTFPEGFLWGSASSSHQVEGDNFYNDWWISEQKKKVPFSSYKATDHYNRFEEDFDIAQKLHQNAHRFSIEWSRIEPEEGRWNENEIRHYRRVLESIRARGMKTFVTLHHFTNPMWFVDKGGWANIKAPYYFAEYAKIVSQRLGDLIDFLVIFNEPMVYISQGFVRGVWPPFRKNNYFLSYKVFINLVKAHRMAYNEIHFDSPHIPIGVAQNVIDLQPRHKKNIIDIGLTKITDYLWNWSFLNFIKSECDFVGVNYYFHHHVHYRRSVENLKQPHEHSDLGWGIHPEGLLEVVQAVWTRYKKPIYITENGIADASDDKRASFIIDHLHYLHDAITQGAKVKGYFYWALTDNFEWERGFEPRFGLVEIDYKTLKRVSRPSSKVYSEICANNSLD